MPRAGIQWHTGEQKDAVPMYVQAMCENIPAKNGAHNPRCNQVFVDLSYLLAISSISHINFLRLVRMALSMGMQKYPKLREQR
jgi:hypothetical protein